MTALRSGLTKRQILAWADVHYSRAGKWPTRNAGVVRGRRGGGRRKTWEAIDKALYKGQGRLPGGETLAWVLYKHRGVHGHLNRVPFNERQILGWATRYRQHTGDWPHVSSGQVAGFPGVTWRLLDQALRKGQRGLPGGSSLARLLGKHLGVRSQAKLPRLRLWQILEWADVHYYHTGDWPNCKSRRVISAPEEKWRNINNALSLGLRGLRPGSSVARLLAKERGRCNIHDRPPVSEALVVKWAEADHKRTGEWPTMNSGRIADSTALEDTWQRVDRALASGSRGLPGGSSLAKLLAKHKKKRHKHQQPRLTIRKILKWIDGHRRRTGRWPRQNSGAVGDAEGEKWRNIDNGLILGLRGLPGGSSLALLRGKHGRVDR